LALGSSSQQAVAIAERLTYLLDEAFASEQWMDLRSAIASMEPKSRTLIEVTREYLDLRSIDPKPTMLAVRYLCSISGDRKIDSYTREDAKAYLNLLVGRGNSTATIRRRLDCVVAILNYGFSELEIEKRNPFSRLIIKNEGQDRKKRGTFTQEQLQNGYEEALASKSPIWTCRGLMPLL
jgi:hypothetical protein